MADILTHAVFWSTYKGTFVETTGIDYKNQCVDLAQKYVKEVWGISADKIPVCSAKRWVGNKMVIEYATWIENDPKDKDLFPKQGDIVIFSATSYNGNSGHIAIVDSANGISVTVIEQNGAGHAATEGVWEKSFFDKKKKKTITKKMNTHDEDCVRIKERRYIDKTMNVLGWYQKN